MMILPNGAFYVIIVIKSVSKTLSFKINIIIFISKAVIFFIDMTMITKNMMMSVTVMIISVTKVVMVVIKVITAATKGVIVGTLYVPSIWLTVAPKALFIE